MYYVYLGYVTVAKNQKNCGSCAAFASVGMVETAMIKAGAKKEGMDLSEDWLLNCRQDAQFGGLNVISRKSCVYSDNSIENIG